MKNLKIYLLFTVVFLSQITQSQTIVEKYGQLRVEGSKIKDECGRNVQLKGMSYFWHQWEGFEYWNADIVKWLRDDWKIQIVRASMGVGAPGCEYLADPENSVEQVKKVIKGAIKHGLYVIIDFHAHKNYKAEAKIFFKEMASEFGNYPNIIYEIWNEPIGDDNNPNPKWEEIKEYSKEIIAEIRSFDPNNIIVVGTPFYSQRVDIVADDRLLTDATGSAVKNIVYTLHFYAASHFETLREKGEYAISKGLPIFVTECARVESSANGTPNPVSWDAWERWMDDNEISYCQWSLSTKHETSATLQPGASIKGNWDYDKDLRSEGKWARDNFRKDIKSVSPCN